MALKTRTVLLPSMIVSLSFLGSRPVTPGYVRADVAWISFTLEFVVGLTPEKLLHYPTAERSEISDPPVLQAL